MKRIAYSVAGLLAVSSQGAYASSLPQMDPTWYSNQLLWLAISFGALYACVSFFNSSQSARVKAAETMAKALAENNAEAAQAIAKLDHDLARRADQAAAVLEDSVKKASAGIDEAAKSLAASMTAALLAHAPIDASEPKIKLAKS